MVFYENLFLSLFHKGYLRKFGEAAELAASGRGYKREARRIRMPCPTRNTRSRLWEHKNTLEFGA